MRSAALSELHQVIARLALMPQVRAAQPGRSTPSSDEDIGGRRPPGGLDWEGDREPDFRQKSAEYFVRRLGACRTEAMVAALLVEAREALEAWIRTPVPAGQEPQRGDPLWKRHVALSDEEAGSLARRHGISRSYVYWLRHRYGDAA